MDETGMLGLEVRKEEGTAATPARSAKSALATAKRDRCHSQIAFISRKVKEEHGCRKLDFANSEKPRTSWHHPWRMLSD